jgi:hypothetical protein
MSDQTMRQTTAREYKVMLDQRPFLDLKAATAQFVEELRGAAEAVGLQLKGKWKVRDERTIVFLDTPGHAFYRAGFILRQRLPRGKGPVELTLKSMSPDRNISAAMDVRASRGRNPDTKFEEDIGAPFRSRFAHSTTVEVQEPLDQANPSLSDAVAIFRALARVPSDGDALHPDVPLSVVNDVRAMESVLTGAKALLKGRELATLAVILWRGRRGEPLVAEFSFRRKEKEKDIRPETARILYDLFERVQHLKQYSPNGVTKTQFVYGAGKKRGLRPRES